MPNKCRLPIFADAPWPWPWTRPPPAAVLLPSPSGEREDEEATLSPSSSRTTNYQRPIIIMLPIIPPSFFLNPATYAAALRTFGGAGASTLLAYVLAQHLWRHTPEWIREDQSWQALFAKRSQRQQQFTNATTNTGKRLQGNHDHDLADADGNAASTTMADATAEFVDEMASLTAVVQKLEALVLTGYEKLGSRRGGLRRRRRVVRRAAMMASSSRQELLNDTVIADDANSATNDESCCDCNPPGRGQQQSIITQSSLEEDYNDDDEEISPFEWHAALLAYWQLSNQIRKHHPSWRDEVYDVQYKYQPPQVGQAQLLCRNGGTKQYSRSNCSSCNNDNIHESNDGNNDNSDSDSNITCSQIKELQTMLHYAIWAYESNEDLLRSFLESSMIDYDACDDDKNATTNNNGFQLIVHRTTSYMDPINNLGSGEANTTDATSTNAASSSSSKKKRKPPGRVGYYVAISHSQRTLLIGMKGTSTIEELLTDCCGRAVRVDLQNDPHGCFPSHCTPAAANENGGGDTKHDIDDAVNDNIDPTFQPESSLKEAILDEENATSTLHGMESNIEYECVDEELVYVSPCTRSSGAGRYCAQEDESIEVELLLHSSRNYHRQMGASNVRLLDATTLGHHSPTKPNTLPRDVPSVDNVLLFPSAPTLLSSSSPTRDINLPNLTSLSSKQVAQTSEFARSSTDEYVESNGVEVEENRSHKLRGVHEGILHCAQQLLFEISPLVEEYGLSKGYDVVCTGHSLGAGTAIVLAVLIRGRYPELRGLSSSLSLKRGEAYRDHHTRCNGERVRAYAFAPPPVLDRESSLACRHYVISVINGSDIIPRSSLTNLDVLLTVLEAVRSRLVEVGMNPGRSKSARHQQQQQPAKKTNVIASTIALFCKLCEGTEGELLLDPSELRLLLEEAIAEAFLGDGEDDKFYWNEEYGHHLFVPGKLLFMYETWTSTQPTEFAIEETSSVEATRGSKIDTKDRSDQEGRSNDGQFHTMWTNGTNSVLKRFEIEAGSGMVTDHLTTSYQRSLERCQTLLL